MYTLGLTTTGSDLFVSVPSPLFLPLLRPYLLNPARKSAERCELPSGSGGCPNITGHSLVKDTLRSPPMLTTLNKGLYSNAFNAVLIYCDEFQSLLTSWHCC